MRAHCYFISFATLFWFFFMRKRYSRDVGDGPSAQEWPRCGLGPLHACVCAHIHWLTRSRLYFRGRARDGPRQERKLPLACCHRVMHPCFLTMSHVLLSSSTDGWKVLDTGTFPPHWPFAPHLTSADSLAYLFISSTFSRRASRSAWNSSNFLCRASVRSQSSPSSTDVTIVSCG